MVSLYCTLIINKRKTFTDVPVNFQAAVEEKLRELGYDTNGDPLPVVALIINGRRTFAQVPAKFKDAVKADLEALGLDENGNPVDI